MSIFTKALVYIRYKRKIKEASQLLNSCIETYQRNEEMILELEELFKKDAEEQMAVKS